MKINMSTLNELCARHFEFFEAMGRDSVDINRDYYWTIDLDQLYNLEEDPTELGLGSLAEEWQDMELILEGEYEPDPVSLMRLAGLFMAVAEQLLGPTDEQGA